MNVEQQILNEIAQIQKRGIFHEPDIPPGEHETLLFDMTAEERAYYTWVTAEPLNENMSLVESSGHPGLRHQRLQYVKPFKERLYDLIRNRLPSEYQHLRIGVRKGFVVVVYGWKRPNLHLVK